MVNSKMAPVRADRKIATGFIDGIVTQPPGLASRDAHAIKSRLCVGLAVSEHEPFPIRSEAYRHRCDPGRRAGSIEISYVAPAILIAAFRANTKRPTLVICEKPEPPAPIGRGEAASVHTHVILRSHFPTEPSATSAYACHVQVFVVCANALKESQSFKRANLDRFTGFR